MLARLDRRLRIFESNYGRRGGWFVEHKGQTVARLSCCWRAEMFWDGYQLELLTDDEEVRQWLLSQPGPWYAGKLDFRSCEFGELAPHAFAAGGSVIVEEDGYSVVMRGLYFPLAFPWPWEWLLLWWRRRGVFARRGNQWPPPNCS